MDEIYKGIKKENIFKDPIISESRLLSILQPYIDQWGIVCYNLYIGGDKIVTVKLFGIPDARSDFLLGMPVYTTEEKLNELTEIFTRAIYGVKELKITEDNISVYFIKDKREKRLGEKINIEVSKIIDNSEITTEVLCEIADKLARELNDIILSCKWEIPDTVGIFIEVFGNPKKVAFWSNKK